MNQTPATTDPPSPPHADKCCPRCGGAMKRVARRLGSGWADYLQCVECREAVGPLGRPSRPKPAPEPPPMPAGELSARAGSLDALTRAAADNFDAICDRAIDAQRRVLERAWGPLPRLPQATLQTVAALSTEVLDRLGDLLTVLTARIALDVPQQTATQYRGWHRPSKRARWRPVVTGATEAEALEALLSAAAGGDKVVLPVGRDPNRERKAR